MWFRVEWLPITDESGKPTPMGNATPESAFLEAGDADAALRAFLGHRDATLIGTLSRTHGYGSVGTARKGERVYAVQAFWENPE
ncbi:MAG: hypothetical protein ACRD2J_14945 [Thermoanaerobaculia bacterium]